MTSRPENKSIHLSRQDSLHLARRAGIIVSAKPMFKIWTVAVRPQEVQK